MYVRTYVCVCVCVCMCYMYLLLSFVCSSFVSMSSLFMHAFGLILLILCIPVLSLRTVCAHILE